VQPAKFRLTDEAPTFQDRGCDTVLPRTLQATTLDEFRVMLEWRLAKWTPAPVPIRPAQISHEVSQKWIWGQRLNSRAVAGPSSSSSSSGSSSSRSSSSSSDGGSGSSSTSTSILVVVVVIVVEVVVVVVVVEVVVVIVVVVVQFSSFFAIQVLNYSNKRNNPSHWLRGVTNLEKLLCPVQPIRPGDMN
jgi:hypothetical protein